MVRQRQPFIRLHRLHESVVARLARGRFKAITAVVRDLHADHLQRNVPLPAECAAMGLPPIGSGLQSMVDMHRPQRAGCARGCVCEQVQQYGGIQPATEADQHRGVGCGVEQGRGKRIHGRVEYQWRR